MVPSLPKLSRDARWDFAKLFSGERILIMQHNNHRRLQFSGMAVIAVLFAFAHPIAAQNTGQPAKTDPDKTLIKTPPPIPPNITQEDIVQRLRASGMSREQVHAQLRKSGYDRPWRTVISTPWMRPKPRRAPQVCHA
jgi:hypothetical protein